MHVYIGKKIKKKEVKMDKIKEYKKVNPLRAPQGTLVAVPCTEVTSWILSGWSMAPSQYQYTEKWPLTVLVKK
jgi:chaperone required for assembly of F1-ATPase